MKRSVLSVIAFLVLTIGASGAYAGSNDNDKKKKGNSQAHSDSDGRTRSNSDSYGGKDKPRAVPEIDAASGTQALAFVCGVLLIGAERLRRRAQSAATQSSRA